MLCNQASSRRDLYMQHIIPWYVRVFKIYTGAWRPVRPEPPRTRTNYLTLILEFSIVPPAILTSPPLG